MYLLFECCLCVTLVSPSLHMPLTVSPVCVTRACFQVCQMVTECGTLSDSLCLFLRQVHVCVGLSVTVHLWFHSDVVDVRLYSFVRFQVAISGQFQ